MNATADAVAVFRTGVGLIAIIWLYFWLVRQCRVDTLRCRLFQLRDDLFDLAAEDKLDFGHPAYVSLRGQINDLLRFAHRITFWDLMVISVVATRRAGDEKRFSEKMQESLEGLDPTVADSVMHLYRMTSWTLAGAIVRSSLLLWLPSMVLAVLAAGVLGIVYVSRQALRRGRIRIVGLFSGLETSLYAPVALGTDYLYRDIPTFDDLESPR